MSEFVKVFKQALPNILIVKYCCILLDLFGNICPSGAILKRSAADKKLFEKTSKAIVFEDIKSMSKLIDKQSLSTNENKVLKKERENNELYHAHFKTQLSERIKERLVLDCMIRHVGFLTRIYIENKMLE